jgi:hypothetical protein
VRGPRRGRGAPHLGRLLEPVRPRARAGDRDAAAEDVGAVGSSSCRGLVWGMRMRCSFRGHWRCGSVVTWALMALVGVDHGAMAGMDSAVSCSGLVETSLLLLEQQHCCQQCCARDAAGVAASKALTRVVTLW